MLRYTAILLNILLAVGVRGSLQIVPGGTWTATNTGHHIQAHGGGITKVDDTYYWVGEDKTDGSAFQNINCYSSTNLVEWKYERAILTRQGSGDLGSNRVIERPKVIYNKSTKQYVLWMHIDSSNYGEAKTGVATSSTVCGSYSYKGSFQPLNFQSRDMGLFVDDDDKAYLLSEDRKNGLRIDLLSSDYLTVASTTHLWSDHIEAPAMIKKDGVYFMFGSHLTGWDPNDNVYSTATKITGPWSSWKSFADSGSKTYTSQTNFILPVGNGAIYMGDRWVSSNLMRSTYVWLPLTISGTTASMKNAVNWIPDVSTGAVASNPSENSYEGEAATLSGGAKSVSCDGCSGKSAAGYIGGSQAGTAYFASVTSSASTRTTVRVKYLNGDKTERFADISVNGGDAQRIAFLPSGGNDPDSSSLNVDLKSGSNTVKVSMAGSWGPDVDRLMVPSS